MNYYVSGHFSHCKIVVVHILFSEFWFWAELRREWKHLQFVRQHVTFSKSIQISIWIFMNATFNFLDIKRNKQTQILKMLFARFQVQMHWSQQTIYVISCRQVFVVEIFQCGPKSWADRPRNIGIHRATLLSGLKMCLSSNRTDTFLSPDNCNPDALNVTMPFLIKSE